jgi:hypothetical protein
VKEQLHNLCAQIDSYENNVDFILKKIRSTTQLVRCYSMIMGYIYGKQLTLERCQIQSVSRVSATPRQCRIKCSNLIRLPSRTALL